MGSVFGFAACGPTGYGNTEIDIMDIKISSKNQLFKD
jgi:hypothetical protein